MPPKKETTLSDQGTAHGNIGPADGQSPQSLEAEENARDARVAQRLVNERDRIQNIEADEPLTRRILKALAHQPTTSTDLAGTVGAKAPSVCRRLKDLLDSGLVEWDAVEGDKRLHMYRLTIAGRLRLTEHLAFGAPEAPPSAPDAQAALRYLRSALRNAVKMRRQTNRLEDAAIRLRAVRDEANKRDAHQIVIDATAELATTLSEQQELQEVDVLLDDLRRIALGAHPSGDPTLVLPATAYRQHALGHMPETHEGGDLRAKARHLDAAQALFCQLRSSDPTSAHDWKQREAWSVLSLASNLRKRSELEEAIEKTGHAIRLFDELDDVYGRSRCLLMFGFCSRLTGDFGNAAILLDEAYKLASANAFPRLEAELLMQMGEVHRCEGDTRHARAMIEEALSLAERLDLLVTRAFAQSALGAVACQERRLDEAQVALQDAEKQFVACGDLEGLALNARRQAVAQRRLASASTPIQLKAARIFVQTALERYTRLRSPAGVTASEIEQARLTMIRGGQAKNPIGKLLARLDDTRERYALELDPWVPRVLHAFAAEADHRGLRERAERLVKASEERLAAWTKQSLARAVDTTMKSSRHIHADNGADLEMGGEPRGQRDYENRLSLVA